MASANRTFFNYDMTFHDDSAEEGRDGQNNDVTFRDQNYGRHQGANIHPVHPVYPSAFPDLTFMDDQAPAMNPGRSGGRDWRNQPPAPLNLCPPTSADLCPPPPPPPPSRADQDMPMPRTPMPVFSPEHEAQMTGAKRKILASDNCDDGSKRKRGCENEESLNASSDIDAMIRFKRSEMERAEAVRREQTRTLVSLVPIVCDTGTRFPDTVKYASLHELSQMLTQNPALVEDLLKHKPNMLKHFDAITYRNPDKEEVVVDVFKMVSVMASNYLKLVLSSGENDKHFKHLLKRFIKSDFKDVAANAKLLVESCKTQI